MIEARPAQHADGACSACTNQRAAQVITMRYSSRSSGLTFKLCDDCLDELPEVIKDTPRTARQ